MSEFTIKIGQRSYNPSLAVCSRLEGGSNNNGIIPCRAKDRQVLSQPLLIT